MATPSIMGFGIDRPLVQGEIWLRRVEVYLYGLVEKVNDQQFKILIVDLALSRSCGF
jgi:hypothetical protein